MTKKNKKDFKKTTAQKAIKLPIKKTDKIKTTSKKKKDHTNVTKFLSSTRDLLSQTKEQELKN